MRVSFPYMGCVTGYRKLFELLGHEVVMPLKPTQRTIDLGVKYSPEFLCFPFKVMMGTYIEAAQAGVEVIISSGGHGPCRAGLYGEIHERILKSLGYNIEVVIFDSIFKDFGEFYSKLKKVKNASSLNKIAKSLWFIYQLICQMDEIEKKIKVRRAYEQKKGHFNYVWAEIQKMYGECWSRKDLEAVNRKATEMIEEVPIVKVREEERLRVGIVGEIYVVMESSVNMAIEQTLNNMGIEVESVQYISDWVNHNIQPGFIGVSKSHQVIDKARTFVKMNCGGHDMENVGWMVDFKERGFDGIIHLMPFGCLPELVTQSAIPTISKKLGLPILSLSLDEQVGTANNQTRIEAFIDLIRNKKNPQTTQEAESKQDSWPAGCLKHELVG
ncbi:MAG: 2-hydroxyacyl-CoA dehydratase [Clostridia bacterium]